jgi:hypothetical protein
MNPSVSPKCGMRLGALSLIIIRLGPPGWLAGKEFRCRLSLGAEWDRDLVAEMVATPSGISVWRSCPPGVRDNVVKTFNRRGKYFLAVKSLWYNHKRPFIKVSDPSVCFSSKGRGFTRTSRAGSPPPPTVEFYIIERFYLELIATGAPSQLLMIGLLLAQDTHCITHT